MPAGEFVALVHAIELAEWKAVAHWNRRRPLERLCAQFD
jgi:hypothetical protein